ncbi:50S ribosomal protein L9 [Rhodovibrio sodomensis]|uniref:Large ribosomal subunit protein bL9 n=1 Tax=Rhodovibrio sodomensis TaxID=1088 RepID=A0ABS1DFD4_9PROT|nr:50S ribosomal protein L9 [Rhodovibrio sodomensis]MBK1668238.1 50S ribosomal protein L9 [Rhodovibrio sodomensis]
MQVILLERVENLGFMGDEVAVKPGYARNFLLPQKKALRATQSNRAYFQSKRAELEARNAERRKEAEEAAKRIDGMVVSMIRQAGETGQLYGSVTARDIADQLAEQGARVERGQIQLGRQIKTIGLHPVDVRLHPEVSIEITVNVARSRGEADTQLEQGRTVSVEEQQEIADRAVDEVISEVEEMETDETDADDETAPAEETERA